MTTVLWEVWSLTPDGVEHVRIHHSNIVTMPLQCDAQWRLEPLNTCTAILQYLDTINTLHAP